MPATIVRESLAAEVKGLSDIDLIDTLRDAVQQRPSGSSWTPCWPR